MCPDALALLGETGSATWERLTPALVGRAKAVQAMQNHHRREPSGEPGCSKNPSERGKGIREAKPRRRRHEKIEMKY